MTPSEIRALAQVIAQALESYAARVSRERVVAKLREAADDLQCAGSAARLRALADEEENKE